MLKYLLSSVCVVALSGCGSSGGGSPSSSTNQELENTSQQQANDPSFSPPVNSNTETVGSANSSSQGSNPRPGGEPTPNPDPEPGPDPTPGSDPWPPVAPEEEEELDDAVAQRVVVNYGPMHKQDKFNGEIVSAAFTLGYLDARKGQLNSDINGIQNIKPKSSSTSQVTAQGEEYTLEALPQRRWH